MKIDDISKKYAVHLGVTGSLRDRLKADAHLHGMMVFELDLSGLSDETALCAYLEAKFRYPYRTVGLDAAIDLISDLEWFGNRKGYLVIVRGATETSPIAGDFISMFPNILDRWRTQDVPFVIVVEEKGERLLAALAGANEFMERAGRLPWAQPGIGPVDVVVHP
ncbi:hypothetical protein IG195_08820 [Arthrobacter sp. TES]|uniref:Barstar (barnase inhibitor) domain-containing protein n=1 Tax=Paenarthrobacter ureafaciens TaxID=37931 RepID=A0AAX3EHF4_PAEUR|nr:MULTISPECIES: hypothetical protein [Paenarthrobacter]AMB42057.1 hypothetical protein AUT26_18945 [Arthrobacter sp. ATCC 21022]ERI35554.1 hypothetical protein M707_21055 [Arthrobacter sp. AK-YN10]NKR13681.1 hypothetical protein [Arthrobacter sp. M5]NKR17706.1 hypothetical protein [Arthrobacter sp. M6]OEH58173.1 hypothetical protein A5N13_21875 [Arthrobacter sp. D4]OEH58219.1 hypothetical protein A5N17_21610 [Arthrobacter sp. D2]QOI65115.1 hypothetical protein IG195_08820 [Arthrobacter sp. 